MGRLERVGEVRRQTLRWAGTLCTDTSDKSARQGEGEEVDGHRQWVLCGFLPFKFNVADIREMSA
jgi:hypothetical protein